MAARARWLRGAVVASVVGTAVWGGLVPALLVLAGAVTVHRASARRDPTLRPAPSPVPTVASTSGVADGPVNGWSVAGQWPVDRRGSRWAALRRIAASVGWALAAWSALPLLLAVGAHTSGASGADESAWAAGTVVALLLPIVLLGGFVHGLRAAQPARGTAAAPPAKR